MSKLMPLIESSNNAHARALLHAARTDAARSGSQQRLLLALGVGSATTAAGSAAAASSAAVATSAASLKVSAGLAALGASSLPAIGAKWLLIGSLAGVALASSAAAVFSGQNRAVDAPRPAIDAAAKLQAPASKPATALGGAPGPEPTPAREAAPAAPPAPVELPRRAVAASPSVAADMPRPAQAVPSQAAFEAPEHSKLLRDVALLDRARSALRAGDAARALTELNRYDAERETHILDREAQLLRIEALVQSGNRKQASELARAYLAAFPGDAHETRLRALFGAN